MKKIAILGSTGSIGINTLRVAKHLKDYVKVVAIAARSNIDLIEQQVKEFSPEIVGLYDKEQALRLSKRLPHVNLVGGSEGINEIATYHNANFVVSSIVGTAGLLPTMAAISAGKDIGLANKEVLVSAGELVMKLVREKKVNLLPIDSEHSAIFQCLNEKSYVKNILLTGSGGPFRQYSQEQLESVTLEDALKHPTWSMGKKVTIDSSTLMNKGLEVIEAFWLFGIDLDKINVIIHPQSIIHSMVEFVDGSIMAQMSEPNMTVPIQYAITYPKRYHGMLKSFDFTKYSQLTFSKPDLQKFPSLRLAYESIKEAGSMPCYMNAANEVLVNRFLNKNINWCDIPRKLEILMNKHSVIKKLTIDTIISVDKMAREDAAKI